MLAGRIEPLRHAAAGPFEMGEAEASRQSEGEGSRRLVAPSMTVRAARWPHQGAEGTRRTRSSAVHGRLCGRQCTEHWALFARTPEANRWMRGE